MGWTPELDNLVIQQWKEGKSMTEIAAAVTEAGFAVTRSAIAGHKRTLLEQGYDLEARGVPDNLRPAHEHKKQDRSPKTEPQPGRPRAKIPPIMQRPLPPVQHDDGVEYSRLGPHACKALLDRRGNDGFWMCCGKEQHQSSVYCKDHYHRYYITHKERVAHG